MNEEDREHLDASQESLARALRDPAGYIARAQARAALRRTPAQFAVFGLGFCFIGLFSLLLATFLHWLHWFPSRATTGTRTAAAEYLMYLPAMFTAAAPGLLLANLVAHLIAPWRRILDREAARVPGTDYASSQRVQHWREIDESVLSQLTAYPEARAGGPGSPRCPTGGCRARA